MTTLIPKIDLMDGGTTPTGAVNRPFNKKLAENKSVKDFGAVGDGVTDDTTAINNAFASGGRIYFPEGTYKVTTVACDDVSGLSIDAASATFTSAYGNVFVFTNCDDFIWSGGIINAGTGANPALTSLGAPYTVASNFTVFSSNRVQVSNLQCNNSLTNSYPCLTAWVVGQAQFNNNQCTNGGDNSIWFFGCYHMTASNNLILNQRAGRGICFQQVNYGAITGNTTQGGKGEAYNVHGSSNIAITGNSVSDLDIDSLVLGLSCGIGIEWDENATPTTIAAAVADPQLYNNVFSRNITVSGNTISNVEFGVRIGNNVGITGSSYGNQGQVVIDGNNIFSVGGGVITGTSRQIRISNNMISTCNQACVELNMGADTGGYTTQDVYIHGNRFTQFNISNLGYNAVQFQDGTPTVSQRLVLSDNEWDQGNYSAIFSNATSSFLALSGKDNIYANSVATSSQGPALKIQGAFSDQAGAATLTPYIASRSTNEFTQSGTVTDTFTTVLTLPTNSSVMAQIQIGYGDRLVCWGVIFAQAGSAPSLTFTGTGGATYVQMSGSSIQIKGNTSGGTASYGGFYTIKYSLLTTN